MYVGVYAKCDFEKIKEIAMRYGCPHHDSFNGQNWRMFCSYCGKAMGFFEETVLVYPVKDDDVYPLKRMVIGDRLYIVSSDGEDGTNFDNMYNDELRIDFGVMVDALLKFNSLYQEQLRLLSQYGKFEVHFGILND